MLGKIEKVELREIWKHEAIDFTRWLAKKENIDLLCEEIGISISIINTEASVGSFSVDILAEDLNTGHKVIIENQLGVTDHDHLGKLITYASGLEASIVIWIFKDIREEHRKSIDWLNEISNGNVSFFAIEMQLWKIDNSKPAPKFNIISSPNNWANAIKSIQSGEDLSENNIFQLDFWKGYAEYLINTKSTLKPRKPRGQHWYDISIGSSQAHLASIVSTKDNFIRCDLYIKDNKQLFQQLFENKDKIESELGFAMDWQELPNAKASRIKIQKDVENIKGDDEISDAYKWLKEKGEKISSVFQKYI